MTSKLTLLSPKQHHDLRFRRLNDFSFARKQHQCPLLAGEIYAASINYPILFPVNEPIIPHALLSLQPGKNPLVTDDGRWTGAYLPLHYRRYPFFLGREQGADKAAILFDAAAPQLTSEDGQPLYVPEGDDYIATPILEEIKNTLRSFDAAYQETEALCKLLVNAEVLEPARMLSVAGNEKRAISGFQVVNWEKVTTLNDETIANWARTGLIQLIHCHLQSIRRLNRKPQAAEKQSNTASNSNA